MRKSSLFIASVAFLTILMPAIIGKLWAEMKIHGDLNMQSNTIKELKDPIADQDAATKKYVDDNAFGETTFLGLTDTPSLYTGSAGYFLQVNPDGTAIRFLSLPYTLYMSQTDYDANSDSIVDIAAAVSDNSITESSLVTSNTASTDTYLRHTGIVMEWVAFPGMLAEVYDTNLDGIIDIANSLSESSINETELNTQEWPQENTFLGWDTVYEQISWKELSGDDVTISFDGNVFSVIENGITALELDDSCINDVHINTTNSASELNVLRWTANELYWSNLEDTFYTETEIDALLVPSELTASDITDFETAVSANTDVAANTSARHTQNTDTGTTAATFNIGSDDNTASETVSLLFGNQTDKPGLRWNPAESRLEYSNDGTTYQEMGTGGGGGTELTDNVIVETMLSDNIVSETKLQTYNFPITGDYLTYDETNGMQWATGPETPTFQTESSFTFSFADDAVPDTGLVPSDIHIPFDMTITGAIVFCDATGSETTGNITFDIQKTTYDTYPTDSTITDTGIEATFSDADFGKAQKTDVDIAEWFSTTSLLKDDILRIYITAISNVDKFRVILKYETSE